MHLGIVAGEASGDLLGANLIKELKKSIPGLSLSGLGGPQMLAAGFHSISDMQRLSVMGLVEPLLHLPDLFKLRRELLAHFTVNKPDLLIGIDSPDFNLSLELKLRRAGVPVVHYVGPSVWAWRPNRVHKIAAATDLVLTLFPFEVDFYQRYQVPARFVGHPLADVLPLEVDLIAARSRLELDLQAHYIGLLPGSRNSEIKRLAPLFIETAKQLWQKRPEVKFMTSVIHTSQAQMLQTLCQRFAPGLPMQIFISRSHDVMAAANVLLLKSGTVTLEALLLKRPMVIAHRLDPFTYQLARRLIKVPFIGLPNLLAGQLCVPEFIQGAAQPQALAAALLEYLEAPEKREALNQQFVAIHRQLRCNASLQAAEAIKGVLSRKNSYSR